ncbi:NDR1/HIN1-like protein 1 [Andrographis paniculata]|uniref:NDR1/HIN1-like protein 1 n=1 Tax=Andrographis paniculata TaxID=175694 RepID=UPI0021E9606E|nr:NDR1/HIN1-like protein 1 [Andrographis paniculata]
MSEKECGHEDEERKSLLRHILFAVLAVIVLVLLAILLVWLILRPTKPQFVLQDVTVLAFNLSSPNLLTSTLQITLAARNPNSRIGIYYDRVDAYASYRGQHITLPTLLPATYQGHKEVTVWSPFLNGVDAPLSPYLSSALNQDEIAGTVLVNVRVNGRIRWKVGTVVTATYRLDVNCPAYMDFGGRRDGVTASVKYQMYVGCHVDVGTS